MILRRVNREFFAGSIRFGRLTISARNAYCSLLKHWVEEILATNSTQSASLQGSSPTLAKKRLEEALTRLESALDEKGPKMAGTQNLEESLADANKKISVLQDKNATIARRLDGAIERMKTLLGDQ